MLGQVIRGSQTCAWPSLGFSTAVVMGIENRVRLASFSIYETCSEVLELALLLATLSSSSH